MTRFKPLQTMQTIRGDKTLTSTQQHLLLCAVLRTDNESGKVRASLDLLAEDAKLSERSARNAFHSTSENVTAYFRRIDRRRRQVNLWFHMDLTPANGSNVRANTEGSSVTPANGSMTPANGSTTPAPRAAHLLLSSAPTSDSPSPSEAEAADAAPLPAVADLPDYITASNISALVGLHGYNRDEIHRLTAEYDAGVTRDPWKEPAIEQRRLYAGWREHITSNATKATTA